MRKWGIGRFGAWLLLGVLYVLAGADRALAQATGVLTGTVTDGDGVIPGATVTAVDTATSITRTAVSNEQGVFRLLSMPSGRYTIRVELEGFKQITIPDVALYTEFDSREALDAYQVHPAHQEFAAFLAPLRSERRVVDYELSES